DQESIDECCPLNAGAPAAQKRRARLARHAQGTLPRDLVRLSWHRPHRRGEGVNETALRLVDDGRRQVFETERGRVAGEPFGERQSHGEPGMNEAACSSTRSPKRRECFG